jgi:hypothetical protein
VSETLSDGVFKIELSDVGQTAGQSPDSLRFYQYKTMACNCPTCCPTYFWTAKSVPVCPRGVSIEPPGRTLRTMGVNFNG